jgi:50S ribosomal subunit-associated GTPase HflX
VGRTCAAAELKALVQTRDTRTERVFLVGVELKSADASSLRESLDELAELATSAGGEVIGEGTQKLETPNAATYIGKVKAGEPVMMLVRRGDQTQFVAVTPPAGD